MSQENDDQKVFWETFADRWVTQQDEIDALLEPVLAGVLERADLVKGQYVIDVGCGTGTSTLRTADIVGTSGHVLGIDISEPMLKRARETASPNAPVSFLTADAANYAFRSQKFDAVLSRFGVMFFADSVKAFANIRRALKPGARLSMACWSNLDVNPWFHVPMYAAKARLGAPPRVDPDAPGPMAFRNIDRVCGILGEAGYENINGEEVALQLTPPGDLIRVAGHAASVGPASRAMAHFEGTEADFEAIVAQVAEDFAVYDTPQGARVPAAINFFTATAP